MQIVFVLEKKKKKKKKKNTHTKKKKNQKKKHISNLRLLRFIPSMLIFKVRITTAADDIILFLFSFFLFLRNWMSSATKFVWRF